MRNAIVPALLLLFGALSGCGYRWTFDDAFPPVPVEFPHWDPPDSVAAAAMPSSPEAPAIEAVILDSYYYLIHPPGEQDTLAARARRARPRPPARDSLPDSVLAADAADSAAADSAFADSTSAGEPEPLPPVQIDLTRREEEILTRRARVDMERADAVLNVLEGQGARSTSMRDQIQSVRSYLARGRAALERRDFQGAANLALKARILAESLEEGKP